MASILMKPPKLNSVLAALTAIGSAAVASKTIGNLRMLVLLIFVLCRATMVHKFCAMKLAKGRSTHPD
ncbi:hypothetical protein TOL_1091 [Thalassolituus oleivorans MIL-1]|uniref:Uncharacterized protein n=1 Tax=Thalassolituus oleivorans MIL-1 TaxID=1298593 RepID=M5DNJ9_9GAMM|nr:hypothetical protein TOL_1091 [Thalassolituus oleivorans MIL-1]